MGGGSSRNIAEEQRINRLTAFNANCLSLDKNNMVYHNACIYMRNSGDDPYNAQLRLRADAFRVNCPASDNRIVSNPRCKTFCTSGIPSEKALCDDVMKQRQLRINTFC